MSRSFQGSELHYPAVEKEATALIEAVRKWNHFLSRQHFTLVTDQRSVSFMLDNRKRTKIKNNKIQCWRLELSSYSYTILYRPGKDNAAADSLTRAHCNAISSSNLPEIHDAFCHPGVARLLHFVRTKNLPFSTEDVRKVCSNCRVCAELKPIFYRPKKSELVKATKPFERISIDFKGPLPSLSKNKYLFVVVDEYSRFPFAFPCPNMNSSTVIGCLDKLFTLCGMPQFLHSDNAKSFLSGDLKDFLLKRGVASSKSSPNHPTGNSQVERYVGVVWKSIRLALRSKDLPVSCWETVLSDALHSVRSLLNTTTNSTPHELFFNFTRRSPCGKSLPAWLCSPGPVMLRKFVRLHKNDDLVEEVHLLDANPSYASIRYSDGREGNVSVSDLSPCPRKSIQSNQSNGEPPNLLGESIQSNQSNDEPRNLLADEETSMGLQDLNDAPSIDLPSGNTSPQCSESVNQNNQVLRRSTRSNKGVPPLRFGHAFSH